MGYLASPLQISASSTTATRLGWARPGHGCPGLLRPRSPGGARRATRLRPMGRIGRVESDQSVLVPWPFAPLSSRERLMVRVRVWGLDGQPSVWSTLSSVEAGLLSPSDWTARFVTPDWEEDTSRQQPGPLLRREFDVRRDGSAERRTQCHRGHAGRWLVSGTARLQWWAA